MAFVIAVALLLAISTIYLLQQFRSGTLSADASANGAAAAAPEADSAPESLKAA